jgi:putative transposase
MARGAGLMRRSEVPEALADPRTWPGVDVAALSDERRDNFERRERAIYAYLGGSSLASVERETGIHRASVMRLVARCLAPHADGRIQGLRALIPHSRAGQYTRRSPARRRATRGGLSGALGQLFDRFPELPRIIEREIAGDRLGMTKNGRLFGLRDVQSKLLATLREAGLKSDEYPLNYDEMGYRALSVWVHRRLEQRVPLRQVGSAAGAWDATSRPYSVVELDGHKLDLRVRVRYIDNTGVSVDIESERLWRTQSQPASEVMRWRSRLRESRQRMSSRQALATFSRAALSSRVSRLSSRQSISRCTSRLSRSPGSARDAVPGGPCRS